MSRICSKEIISDIYDNEMQTQRKLLNDAKAKVEDALVEKKLNIKAYDAFKLSGTMLDAAESSLKDEDFRKALQFLIRSVANYYLMLGDKGVLRHG